MFLLAVGASPTLAAHGSDASRLYAPCGVCHQPGAGGSLDGAIPSLAGQHRWYLERQMKLFRAGERTDTAMEVVTRHPILGNPQSVRVLAGYLASLNVNPQPVQGAGNHLQLGQETFTHICASCHGADGGGSRGSQAPRIGKQHYPYMRRQIEAASRLHMDFAPPEMASALRGMNSQEKDAVADYVSRLDRSNAFQEPNQVDDRSK